MSWIAFFATLVSVYLNTKKNIWTWPTGILSGILWGISALMIGNYPLFLLQLVLISMSIYGWIRWSRDSVDTN